MACLQVKLCVAISECFRKCIWYLKALYKCPDLLYFLLYLLYTVLCRTMILRAARQRQPVLTATELAKRKGQILTPA